MRNLIIVRHGDYQMDGTLTESAITKLLRISELLAERVYLPCRTLCSVQERARNTADLLIHKLNLTNIDYCVELATGGDAPDVRYIDCDKFAVNRIVNDRAKDYESVILVTHFEFCNYYLDLYTKGFPGLDEHSRRMNRGEALIITPATYECEWLRNEGSSLSWKSIQ